MGNSVEEAYLKYQAFPLDESIVAENPFIQFAEWFDLANQAGLYFLANAVTLATVTPEGLPDCRVVLLKDFDEQGFVFYTNYDSPKGNDLALKPAACLNFYWPLMERQVRISGQVQKVSRTESEAYFASRPRESQLGAWASFQSAVVPGRDYLEKAFQSASERFEGKEVPCPPYWGGFRLAPEKIEFWQMRPNRYHDRILYTRPAGSAEWKIERLSP